MKSTILLLPIVLANTGILPDNLLQKRAGWLSSILKSGSKAAGALDNVAGAASKRIDDVVEGAAHVKPRPGSAVTVKGSSRGAKPRPTDPDPLWKTDVNGKKVPIEQPNANDMVFTAAVRPANQAELLEQALRKSDLNQLRKQVGQSSPEYTNELRLQFKPPSQQVFTEGFDLTRMARQAIKDGDTILFEDLMANLPAKLPHSQRVALTHTIYAQHASAKTRAVYLRALLGEEGMEAATKANLGRMAAQVTK